MQEQLLSIPVHMKVGAKQAQPFLRASRGVWLLESSRISCQLDPCFVTALRIPRGFLFWGLVIIES